MIEVNCHCDFCGQIIDRKQRYFELDSKGPNSFYELPMDVCLDCFKVLKSLKEKKNAN